MDFNAFLAVIFPPRCVGCRRTGCALCDACLAYIAPLSFDLGVISCTALGRYEGTLRDAVLCLKNGRRDVGERLTEIMAQRLGGDWDCAVRLVPVPTTRLRALRRGFDQAELLAHGLASRLGLPSANLLRRVGGPLQQGKTRAQRLRAAGRFRVSVEATSAPGGGAVLLVDDVATTGATLREAAAALEEAGLAVCGAMVAARADV